VLTQLKFAPGLVIDDTDVASEPYWSSGNRVRFVRGRPQPIGGWSKRFATQLNGKCRGIHAWINRARDTQLALGTHTKLYLVEGGVLYDVTPSGLAAGLADAGEGGGYGLGTYGSGQYGLATAGSGFLRTWSLDHWGEFLLAVPKGGTLYEWQGNPAALATAVSGAPSAIDSMFVDPNRFVVLLGTTEQGTGQFDPMLVRWSDQEDYTNYTAASTNKAGEYPLSDGGRIVGGAAGAPSLIWTDTALYQMRLLDGAAVFGFPPVASNCGLIGPHAAAERDGQAWWMGANKQFHAYAGGAPEPLDCPLKDHVFKHIDYDQTDKIACGVVGQFNEVWWFYPDERDGNECSRYVAYNTIERTWTAGELARTAWIDAGVFTAPIGVSADGYVYDHETGMSADGAAIGEELISGAFDMGEGETLVRVNGLLPDFKGVSGTLQISLLTQMEPNGAETLWGPWTVNAATTRISFQAQGRHARIKIASMSAPSFWRLGAPRWDVIQTGMKR
jgi:hypothetical protein